MTIKLSKCNISFRKFCIVCIIIDLFENIIYQLLSYLEIFIIRYKNKNYFLISWCCYYLLLGISIKRAATQLCRSNRRRCFIKKGVLINFVKFIGKYYVRVSFVNKVAGVRPATLSKKRLWGGCFLLNFAKFIRTHFYKTPLGDCLWL